MRLDFIRGEEQGRAQGIMSADLYNKIHVLFAKSDTEALFVPIRTMAYLAIIDIEEVIFVDSQHPRIIEISWRDFHPGKRENIHDPVAFTCIYYIQKNDDFMNRIHSEFLKTLELMAARLPKSEASITTINKQQ